MPARPDERHLLVDLGNSSVKVGELPSDRTGSLVETVAAVASLAPAFAGSPEALLDRDWGTRPIRWHLASVNPPAATRWSDRIAALRPDDSLRLLTRDDFPMPVEVRYPERLGLDRLAAAHAAALLKRPAAGAIVIDAGTATTVDAVSADGRFLGGAILASPALMLRSLAEHTRLLPKLDDRDAESPPESIGRDTEEALRSGAFWGQVGAVRMLIERHRRSLPPEIDLFLCGGIAAGLEAFVSPPPRRLAGLVLAGIAAVVK